ncbi:MAG: ATP/GTP-binding protein [Cytophagales bacterium]|nr:ATP/GTP-binding protein [Cytophaga sp.]
MIPIGIALLSFTKPEHKSAKHTSLTKKWATDTIMKVPESVLYNPLDKFIYVANINGHADVKDGNGFISRLTLDGKIEKLKWVEGLDAPKGMGIYNWKLYVTDITKVVIIDIATGQIEKTIDVKGAVFLNDISIDKAGNVYITDSSDKKIYTLKDGVVEVWIENSVLQKPNGVLAMEKGLCVIDMGTGIFYEIAYKDKTFTKIAEGVPVGDGVMTAGKGEYIISCWPGEVYYIKGSAVEKILDTKEQKLSAADAWYIESEKLLIVPTFYGNSVVAYTVTK